MKKIVLILTALLTLVSCGKQEQEVDKTVTITNSVELNTYDADMAMVKRNIKNGILIFEDVYIEPSAFAEDTTYTDYPYKADITCEGVTADYIPDVIFSNEDVLSGILAPSAEAGNNIVTIYASEIPEDPISIPVIECRRVGSDTGGSEPDEPGGEISDEDIATDEEVQDMIDSIFN